MDAIVENRREALKAKAPERRLWWRRVLMLGGVAIVVVGGLGSLSGALVASLLIGLLQTFAILATRTIPSI